MRKGEPALREYPNPKSANRTDSSVGELQSTGKFTMTNRKNNENMPANPRFEVLRLGTCLEIGIWKLGF